jgi:hypothetical protein
MGAAFDGLPVFLSAVLYIGSIVALSILGAWVVRRYVGYALLSEHNELAGFMLAVVGVVYAVLLAFMAISVWERYEAAEVRTYHEANTLVDIYRNVAPFARAHMLRAEIRAYAREVIEHEWPLLQKGEHSPSAEAQSERIASEILALPVHDAREQNAHAALLSLTDDELSDRASRTSLSASGLNPLIYWILGAGAAITIAFTFLFGFKSRTMQFVMTALYSATIALVLYLVVSLDYPFGAGIRVSPEAFQNALHLFGTVGS